MIGTARGLRPPGHSMTGTGRQMKTLKLALVAAAGLLVSGCGQATEVTVYEPGVYKGAKDPLLSETDNPAYRQAMQERFQRGQTDRQSPVESAN